MMQGAISIHEVVTQSSLTLSLQDVFRGTISLYDKLRVDKDPSLLLTKPGNPKDAAIDRVNDDFILSWILITFAQDVKVDQAACGNISNIEPFYSSLRDGRFVVVVFTTILLVISTHSLTNQQLALFLTILGSDSSQDHESISLADVKKEILCWKSANVLTELPLL